MGNGTVWRRNEKCMTESPWNESFLHRCVLGSLDSETHRSDFYLKEEIYTGVRTRSMQSSSIDCDLHRLASWTEALVFHTSKIEAVNCSIFMFPRACIYPVHWGIDRKNWQMRMIRASSKKHLRIVLSSKPHFNHCSSILGQTHGADWCGEGSEMVRHVFTGMNYPCGGPC